MSNLTPGLDKLKELLIAGEVFENEKNKKNIQIRKQDLSGTRSVSCKGHAVASLEYKYKLIKLSKLSKLF